MDPKQDLSLPKVKYQFESIGSMTVQMQIHPMKHTTLSNHPAKTH